VKLSHSTIDNVLTNLLPAGLQDFFQVLNVSNATTTVNKLLETGVLPRSNSPLGLCLGYSATNFLVPLILAHEDAKCKNATVCREDEPAHHPVEKSSYNNQTSHRILITAEYLNAHVFSVFLFVCALQMLKASFYANFRKLG